ncbi:MAG: hypothetical protein KDA37_07680 [Planctomycetales bacterium]|nr:hypothetical protein [Planctomycetales bacterium]
MRRLTRFGLFSLLAATLCAPQSYAAAPYSPVPVVGPPTVGPGVVAPRHVYGKEFSHDIDLSIALGGPDPQQVINWDGVGGVIDGIDYSGATPFELQVDAIANQRDALFRNVMRDDAHLVYSIDDMITVYTGGGPAPFSIPHAGPITLLPSGQTIGGSGEVSMEMAGAFAPPSTHLLWASQPEVSKMPLPEDVDGLELWGPEPVKVEEGGVFIGDADKFSQELDSVSGVSVWNASGSPYVFHPMIVSAVESLLGPIPFTAFLPYDQQEGRNAINLDALMVLDSAGRPDEFDLEFLPPLSEDLTDQAGRPLDFNEHRDTIIFSIRQIIDPIDPDGYYATGSELFVLDSLSGASFLVHGGHVWDQAYALSELGFKLDDQEDVRGVLDINALEAIGDGQEIPVGPCPGDFNGDHVVNAADYTLWRDNLGSSDETLINSNGLLDGVINHDDYLVWRNHYGTICPSPILAATTGSVPEPVACLLLGLASVALCWTRARA